MQEQDAAAATAPAAPPAKTPSASQQALALVKTSMKEFDSVAAGLEKLKKKYGNVVFDVSTTKGMAEALKARAEVREPRYALSKALDAAKKPLNTLKNELTIRAEAITNEILAVETPIDEQIKAEERRKADEKAAREAADRARVLAITGRIAEFRAQAVRAGGCRTAERVQLVLDGLNAMSLEGLDEFEAEGILAHGQAVQAITTVLQAKQAEEAEREAARVAREAEEARLAELQAKQAAEAAKLAEERAAFALQQQEAADKQAAQQAEIERMRAELEASKATIPAAVAPEKQALADEIRATADIGIALANDLLESAPSVFGVDLASGPDLHVEVKFTPGVPSSHDAQIAGYEFVTNTRVITRAEAEEMFPARDSGADGVAQTAAGTTNLLDSDEPSDDELMTVAIEAVSGYFGLSEEQAMARLSAIKTWLYQGKALAA